MEVADSSQHGEDLVDLQPSLLLHGWTLHERLQDAAQANGCGEPEALDAALQAWRRVVAPDRPAHFEKRLAWDGLSVANAAWALQPPRGAPPQDPPWWPLLLGLGQAARQAAGGAPDAVLDERCTREPFVHVWRPAAAWALRRLQRRVRTIGSNLELSDSAWGDLGEALLLRLCSTADQALWELFNQRRTPGQMLLAHLGRDGDGRGEPVRDAYDAFVAELHRSGYGLLLSPYPVLGRLLATVTQLWLASSEEMLLRLAGERATLQRHFAIACQATLTSIQLGLSDPHRGGRVVAILSFLQSESCLQEGRDVRVVYKPKDMRVDESYQQVLNLLNLHSCLPPLRCLTVVDCGGYGFMEWVEHRLAQSEVELEAFYANAGRLLAVLHFLGCTDCHHENLIASGEQLVLIDTETLLEADLRDLISGDEDGDGAGAGVGDQGLSELQRCLRNSVLRSGLLPQWLTLGAGRKRAFDISALGIQPPPPQREQPGWFALNSDGMMAGRLRQPCDLPTSLPVGLGQRQRLTDFTPALCRGFMHQMQDVLRLRPRLLEALQAFRGQPRRLVARATRIYFTIQRQMLEPASLRDALCHGLKLEQLSRSYLLSGEQPANWPMFRAEILQMQRLDIPFFEHLIDAEELPLCEGLAAIPAFMTSSGLEAARRRLQDLDPAQIDFQQQLIRGAIAARHLQEGASPPAPAGAAAPARGGDHAPLLRPELRQEACQLAEELWRDAIRDPRGWPEWIGLDLGIDGETFRFGLVGQGLYAGASGIALLFARLAAAGAHPEASLQRAEACLAPLGALAERRGGDGLFHLVRDQPYGLAGTGGILLALQLLAGAGLAFAAPLAERLVDQLQPERLRRDEGMDVISGVAGLVGPLLAGGHGRALELAAVCGERLLALQLAEGGWPRGGAGRPLTGFSHGAAGMAAALACLARATGEARFADAARRALAYERSLFDSTQGNWPDFRRCPDGRQFMLSWCHGAPGILLSRLVLQASDLDDDHGASERQRARQSTLSALRSLREGGGAGPAHLCCGSLGLTSLLRLEAQAGGTVLDPEVAAVERAVVERARAQGGYSFLALGDDSLRLPGLFTGRAGVGLALLEAGMGLDWMPAILSAGLLAPHRA